jgi:hypothetical protein
MESTTLAQTSTRLVLPVWQTPAQAAHHSSVGFLAVQGAETQQTTGARATGGSSLSEQPRYITCSVQLQPITDAGNGISVSAAQGSQKPAAPMGAKASGVPPRSRPV